MWPLFCLIKYICMQFNTVQHKTHTRAQTHTHTQRHKHTHTHKANEWNEECSERNLEQGLAAVTLLRGHLSVCIYSVLLCRSLTSPQLNPIQIKKVLLAREDSSSTIPEQFKIEYKHSAKKKCKVCTKINAITLSRNLSLSLCVSRPRPLFLSLARALCI